VPVLDLFTLEARFKRRLREHFRAMGYRRDESGYLVPPGVDKDSLRALHAIRRRDTLKAEDAFIRRALPTLRKHFASGSDVDPTRISARLEIVESGTWQAELFRLASLTWSMPVSRGYGRRFRVLVWDDSNEKLVGILALGDPVFNLKARDEWIGWSVADRKKRLVNVLDAFVLGAVPPYNQLLGGKLVASLVRTKEIRDYFARRYRSTKGVISGKRKHPSLVLVTTTSAFGRSSLYNRLRLGDVELFQRLGFTSGYGHFHISDDLFRDVRDYLRAKNHIYEDNHQFGDGPSWRLRAVRAALSLLGVKPSLIKHGVQREVFACSLATNARRVLTGEAARPNYRGLQSASEVSGLARERWMVPRALRVPDYRHWNICGIDALLMSQSRSSATRPSQGSRHVARAL
jgi:hypothetical protein